VTQKSSYIQYWFYERMPMDKLSQVVRILL